MEQSLEALKVFVANEHNSYNYDMKLSSKQIEVMFSSHLHLQEASRLKIFEDCFDKC